MLPISRCLRTVTPDHPAKNSAARGRSLHQVMLSLKQPRLAFVLVIYFLFIVAFSIMTTSFSLYTMFRFVTTHNTPVISSLTSD